MKALIILLLSVSMYGQVSPANPLRAHAEATVCPTIAGLLPTNVPSCAKADEARQGNSVSSGGPVAQVESKKIVSGLRNAPDRSDGRYRPGNGIAPLERTLQVAMVASAAFDTGTTIHNLRNGCHEDNPLMGSHPSTARVIAFEAGWTAGELVVAHFLKHRHPKIAAVLLGESTIEHGVAGGLNTTQKCF